MIDAVYPGSMRNDAQCRALGDGGCGNPDWTLVTSNASRMGDWFERMTQAFYSKVVRSGDTVVDGGAHTGRHTIPLAVLVGRHGRVLAFEPLPGPAERLRGLLAGTALDGRVRLRSEALAREPGRCSFYVVNNMPEYSGLRRREYVGFQPDHTEIEVGVTTIDAAVGNSVRPGTVSFVKLDLEGGEFRAFQGAVETLRVHRPSCVFENGLSSSATDYGASDFFGFFDRVGYEVYDIFGNRVVESVLDSARTVAVRCTARRAQGSSVADPVGVGRARVAARLTLVFGTSASAGAIRIDRRRHLRRPRCAGRVRKRDPCARMGRRLDSRKASALGRGHGRWCASRNARGSCAETRCRRSDGPGGSRVVRIRGVGAATGPAAHRGSCPNGRWLLRQDWHIESGLRTERRASLSG